MALCFLQIALLTTGAAVCARRPPVLPTMCYAWVRWPSTLSWEKLLIWKQDHDATKIPRNFSLVFVVFIKYNKIYRINIMSVFIYYRSSKDIRDTLKIHLKFYPFGSWYHTWVQETISLSFLYFPTLLQRSHPLLLS